MSLVERALKKIQESRAAIPPRIEVPVAAPVPAPAARGPKTEHGVAVPRPLAESAEPRRTVHIDRAALRAEAVLPPESQERLLADQYRHIKRPIIAKAFGRGEPAVPSGHLIMVASALAGEGKTFTSINLALSMAMEKDITVLIVDADVAKPRVSTIFGLNKERGLLDLLRDENLDPDSIILPTDVPRLSILPAGKHSELATEMFASARMQQLVETLSSRDPNRIVLFDSPPLLLTSESRVLATVVGQIALVVRAGATPQRAVLDALDLLSEDKPTGLVLNQSDEQTRTGYYQYYGPREESPQPED